MDLQAEVKRFREYLWVRYGKNDEIPPFHPETLRIATIAAGSHNLFGFVLNGMTSEDASLERQVLNEKKVVAILYMLMFRQSQKQVGFKR